MAAAQVLAIFGLEATEFGPVIRWHQCRYPGVMAFEQLT
jgi:hypothetical protein